jgi:hypothetical protein
MGYMRTQVWTIEAELLAGDGISKPYFASGAFAQLIERVRALGKRLQISEDVYPNDPTGTSGRPDAGCPFSPEGQAVWTRDFLAAVPGRPEVERVFYFYPEYVRGMSHGDAPDIESSGLFRSDHEFQPALRVFFP